MSEIQGKVCIVTGSNSGIGKETALALASMRATVVMVVRNKEEGSRARAHVVKVSGNDATDLMICDVSSTSSIRSFANEFIGKYNRLNVLINNAGAVFSKRETTVDGFESTFAVDYLGMFLLTHELLPLLRSSAPSRIINLGSGLSKSGRLDLNDLQSEKSYNGMRVYANAKLMVLMFTYALARRLEGSGVAVNAVMPGFAATSLGRNTGSLRQSVMFKLVRPMQISPKKAAEPPVYLASSEKIGGVTGKCFAKKQEVTTAPVSYDQELQEKLWNKSLELLGMTTF
jgi:NAD(P)-dependent dehydrogenase (short-subunit alcohol dehydrogenase family)